MNATRALALTACALTGCSPVSADTVRSHFHQAVSAAGTSHVSVSNVSGTIKVRGSATHRVVVDAVIHGSSEDEIGRTHVVVRSDGSTVVIETKYDSGSWFHSNGASVDYTIDVPRASPLDVSSVSGDVEISGVDDDVHASTVSGAIDALLGTVSGRRTISAHAVSGEITLHIARNSNATISADSVSGDQEAFFALNRDSEPGHSSARGRIGNGSASIRTSTVSGSTRVLPQ